MRSRRVAENGWPIAKKILESLGASKTKLPEKALGLTGQFISGLIDTLKIVQEKADLDPAFRKTVELFLNTNKIIVYLDDLDRGWNGKIDDIVRLSTLCNAAKDLAADNDGLQFRLALRSDVYFLIRKSEDSTDKIEGSVIWYAWTNHEILVLLAKRIMTYFGEANVDDKLAGLNQHQVALYLKPVIAPRFEGKGHWQDIPTHRMMMSLVRKRPRDMIKLCTLAARNAFEHDSNQIGSANFQAIFQEYSQGRITDTVNEFKSELREIERLIMNMRPTTREKTTRESFTFDTGRLLAKLTNVITNSGQFTFANGLKATPKDLAHFLYKINFITARKDLPSGEIDRKYFEENRYLQSAFADFGYSWEIHPAYRWALYPESIDDILRDLRLEAESS